MYMEISIYKIMHAITVDWRHIMSVSIGAIALHVCTC